MRGKQHRRDANKAAHFAAIEEALRAALNGETEQKEEPVEECRPEPRIIRRPVHHRPLHQHKTTIRYSVRHYWGGDRFVVSYTGDTISELVVQAMAHRDFATKRYIEPVHLDTVHV